MEKPKEFIKNLYEKLRNKTFENKGSVYKCNPLHCFCTGECKAKEINCLWDKLPESERNKPMMLSCPCNKCSPVSF